MLGVRGPRRLLAAHLTIDESTAVGVGPAGDGGRAARLLGHRDRRLRALERHDAGRRAGRGRDRRPPQLRPGRGGRRRLLRAGVAAAQVGRCLRHRCLAAVVAVLVAPHAPAGVPVLVAALSALLAAFWRRAHHDPQATHQLGGRDRSRARRRRRRRHDHVDRGAGCRRLGVRPEVPRLRDPARWLEGERTSRVTSALPIALLAALVGVQTLTTRTGGVVLDSRAAAVGRGAGGAAAAGAVHRRGRPCRSRRGRPPSPPLLALSRPDSRSWRLDAVDSGQSVGRDARQARTAAR